MVPIRQTMKTIESVTVLLQKKSYLKVLLKIAFIIFKNTSSWSLPIVYKKGEFEKYW